MLNAWLSLKRAIAGYHASELDVEAAVAGAILVSFGLVAIIVRAV